MECDPMTKPYIREACNQGECPQSEEPVEYKGES